MTKATRGRYTLEFKQEAVRLVESGQSQAARNLGVVEQTLGNWIREHRAGTLKGASSKPQVTAEQMEVSRLRAELARVTMERDILHPTDEDLSVGTPSWEKPRRILRSARNEVRLYSTPQAGLADLGAVPGAAGERLWLSSTLGEARAYCPAPPSERRGAVGSHQRRLRGEPRCVWLAAHLAATAGARHSRGQTRSAEADAEARHSSSRQAKIPRYHDRQQA